MSIFEVLVYPVKLEKHPDPEVNAIEMAIIGDYRSIVQMNTLVDGDLVAYIPEGAIVPEWILEKMNLVGRLAGKKGNRVKAVRLRGAISQGLCYPLEYRTDVIDVNTHEKSDVWVLPTSAIGGGISAEIGDNVTEALGITKYEPPTPVHMGGEVFNAFGYTPKYDIENWKKWPDVIEEGEEVVFTEKAHGCADYNTMIETVEHGSIKIGKLVEAKLTGHVKSYDIISNTIQYNQIIGWSVQNNNDDWYELKTESDDIIKLTGNHLVWLPHLNCYRAVRELQVNDILLLDA